MPWHHANTQDDLKSFYESILPAIRLAALQLGYAIGVHGSQRRDLDLIAAPWTDEHADANALAVAIQIAACGLKQVRYEWEQKPCGRIATSFPVCWSEYKAVSAGHIDLSVAPTVPRQELVMRSICEGLVAPEIEDAVNTCYEYVYNCVNSALQIKSTFHRITLDEFSELKDKTAPSNSGETL